MSPSESHWLSLHRNLTSPEEREYTDFIGIVDSESNQSLHTEEVLNGSVSTDSNKPIELPTDVNAENVSDGVEHDPDSLEDAAEPEAQPLPSQANRSLVPHELQQYPCERERTLALESEHLKVWYQKIWTPDSLRIAVKVENVAPDKDGESFSIRQASEDEDFPMKVRTMSIFNVV